MFFPPRLVRVYNCGHFFCIINSFQKTIFIGNSIYPVLEWYLIGHGLSAGHWASCNDPFADLAIHQQASGLQVLTQLIAI